MRARGTTLYSTATLSAPGCCLSQVDPHPQPGYRLIESHDAGLTWQPIDGALVSAGQTIFDYALVPGSSTIFAVTGSAAASQAPAPFELWRSDDDGAHWRQLASAPSDDLGVIFAGTLAGEPVLYSYPVNGAGMWPQVLASTDGGSHWSVMPSTGIVPDYTEEDEPVGVLANGSVLVPVDTGRDVVQPACHFYMWAPGESHVQAFGTQPAGDCSSALLVPAGPVGPASLWVMYYPTSSSSVTAWLSLAGA